MSARRSHPLQPFGWDDEWQAAWDACNYAGMLPGRVYLAHGRYLELLTADGEVGTYTSGRLHLSLVRRQSEAPLVGDWVAWAPHELDQIEGRPYVHAVLPRRSYLARRRVDRPNVRQALAANVDMVVIVTSTTGDLNLRRLERYLIMAREGGVNPVIVLNKIDLDDDWKASLTEIATVAGDCPVLATSAEEGDGMKALRKLVSDGITVAFVGSSGVGKSTLINVLANDELLPTGEIREDGKGRHTTSRRELLVLPTGALLIDTPGIRELLPFEDAEKTAASFPDIEALGETCRFRNCRHGKEPDCAVRAAVERGELAAARLENWHRIQLEITAAANVRPAPEGRPQRHGQHLRDVQGRGRKKR